jgi:hypothetical protein
MHHIGLVDVDTETAMSGSAQVLSLLPLAFAPPTVIFAHLVSHNCTIE